MLTRNEQAQVYEIVNHVEVYKRISKKFHCEEGDVLHIYHRFSGAFLIDVQFGDYPINWMREFVNNDRVYVWNDRTLGDWNVDIDESGHPVLRYVCKLRSYALKESTVINEVSQRCKEMGLRVDMQHDNFVRVYGQLD